MLLSVIIVSLNTKDHLEKMLTSLVAVKDQDSLDLIVVDISSTDGTVEMVKSRFPQVTLLEDVPNNGYGASANTGMTMAQGTHFIVCNSDIVFPEGAVERIMSFLEEAGQDTLMGFKLEGPDGKMQRSAIGLPGRWDLVWMFSAIVNSKWKRIYRLGNYLPDWSYTERTPVGWVTGAAMAASRSLYERLQGFDEEFFLFSEEVDLCKRVHDLGGQVLYAPEVSLIHVGRATLPRGKQRTRWIAAGRARYTRKHFGHLVLFLARIVAVFAYLSSVCYWLVRWMRRHMTWKRLVFKTQTLGGALVEIWRV